jgi:hypothetical protein
MSGADWASVVLGGGVLIAGVYVVGYTHGEQAGKASVVCPAPKVVRGEYSTEELHRMIRARKRMEAVK